MGGVQSVTLVSDYAKAWLVGVGGGVGMSKIKDRRLSFALDVFGNN